MLGVVILNYLSWQDTLRCAENIARARADAHILIVDNGSPDDSFVELKRTYAGRPDVSVISTGANLGYAKGNNVGLRIMSGKGIEYCLVVNPDVMIAEDAIATLLKAMVEHQDVVVCGPAVYNSTGKNLAAPRIKEPGMLEATGLLPARLDDPGSWVRQGKQFVYWCSGACLLVRLRSFLDMGSFDEGTFLYNEENCYGRQAELAGLRVLFVPEASATHYHRTPHQGSAFAEAEYVASGIYYWRKYRNASVATLVFFLVVRHVHVLLKMATGRMPWGAYREFRRRTRQVTRGLVASA